jgi:HSP20 family molecular chaperone IbpA
MFKKSSNPAATDAATNDFLDAIARGLEDNLNSLVVDKDLQGLIGSILKSGIPPPPISKPSPSSTSESIKDFGFPKAIKDFEVYENETSVIVYIDAPGIHKKDILISYEVSVSEVKTLNVSYERQKRNDPGLIQSHLAFGKNEINLLVHKASQACTIDDISAKYENGVIMITIPKQVKETTKFAQVL